MKKLIITLTLLISIAISSYSYTFEHTAPIGGTPVWNSYKYSTGIWINAQRSIQINTDVYNVDADDYTPHAWALVKYKYTNNGGTSLWSTTYSNYDYVNDIVPNTYAWGPFYHANQISEVQIQVYRDSSCTQTGSRSWARVDIWW